MAGGPKKGAESARKGIPNKRTHNLVAILDAAGFCPVAKLIQTYERAEKEYLRAEEIHDAIQDNRADKGMLPLNSSEATQWLSIAKDCAKDLMPYMYPKRKAIEFVDPDGKPLFSFADLVKRAADDV